MPTYRIRWRLQARPEHTGTAWGTPERVIITLDEARSALATCAKLGQVDPPPALVQAVIDARASVALPGDVLAAGIHEQWIEEVE